MLCWLKRIAVVAATFGIITGRGLRSQHSLSLGWLVAEKNLLLGSWTSRLLRNRIRATKLSKYYAILKANGKQNLLFGPV